MTTIDELVQQAAARGEGLLLGGIDPGLSSGALVVVDALKENEIVAAYSFGKEKNKRLGEQAAGKVLDSWGQWGDKEYLTAHLRAQLWIDELSAALDEIEEEHGEITAIAVESFVDQRSRAREEKSQLLKDRWKTPHVIGLIAQHLVSRDLSPESGRLVYQNAGLVIRRFASEIGALEERERATRKRDAGNAPRRDSVVPNDVCITNDHQRKALVHALQLSIILTDIKNDLLRPKGVPIHAS